MRFVLPSVRIPMGRRSHHPLLRVLSLLLGLAVIGVLLTVGLVVGGVLLIGGAILFAVRQWKRTPFPSPQAANSARPSPRTQTLEGEFVVISQSRPAAH